MRSTEATYPNPTSQIRLDRKPGLTGGDQQRRAITGDKYLDLRIEGKAHVAQTLLGLRPTVHGDDPPPFTCQQLGKQCYVLIYLVHVAPFTSSGRWRFGPAVLSGAKPTWGKLSRYGASSMAYTLNMMQAPSSCPLPL